MDWIQEFIVNPMAQPDKYAPYNWVNTIVFAVAALVAAYLIYKGLKHFRVKIDERFFFAIIPFVFFGGLMRVVVDAELLPRAVTVFGHTLYPFITPGIYFVTFGLVVAALVAARIASKRLGKDFASVVRNTGIVLAVAAFLPLLFLAKNFLFLAAIIGLTVLALAAFVKIDKLRKIKSLAIEKATILGQSLDGAATFVGVGFAGYVEQHVVAGTLFSFANPLWFFLIKFVFAFAVVELLRREKIGGEPKTFLLLLITIFGLAPGIRDAARILCGI